MQHGDEQSHLDGAAEAMYAGLAMARGPATLTSAGGQLVLSRDRFQIPVPWWGLLGAGAGLQEAGPPSDGPEQVPGLLFPGGPELEVAQT